MSDLSVATAVAIPIPVTAVQTASDHSVEAYLASAEQTKALAAITLYVASALIVLILLAWALGILPGAVRIF